ncbi:hypothetical protein PCANC_21754 [Puccinia coronata f. sp. avenae]|uniref:Uncharacterized protein n=1 Tax=Puccinia coronata f. sp. avenae TaxID=200324 RepID=A0A2N5SKJ1_9BASI|nr:hypothetical protein PCANC_21754 [Puccinia coronata f. sp. avenae]
METSARNVQYPSTTTVRIQSSIVIVEHRRLYFQKVEHKMLQHIGVQKRPLEASHTKPEPAPPMKKPTVQMMCSGLNDLTWERPKSTLTIEQCIKGSPSSHHGAPPRHELLRKLKSLSTWFIKRHDATSGIFLMKCEQQIDAPPGRNWITCRECEALKGNNSLKKSLNTKYASEDNIKFIPASLMKRDLFQAKLMHYEELRYLNTSLEKQSKTGDGNFWNTLAIQAKKCFFKEMDAFQGLVKAVAV